MAAMQWCANGCRDKACYSGDGAYSADHIVAWVNANGGEARYESECPLGCEHKIGAWPRIALRRPDRWVHARPGHYIVMGEATFRAGNPDTVPCCNNYPHRTLRDFYPCDPETFERRWSAVGGSPETPATTEGEPGMSMSWEQIEKDFTPKQVEGLKRLQDSGVGAFNRGRSAEAAPVVLKGTRPSKLRPGPGPVSRGLGGDGGDRPTAPDPGPALSNNPEPKGEEMTQHKHDVFTTYDGFDSECKACAEQISEAAIERAAMALYEHGRDPEYMGAEWDWPNIDRSYDWDGDDDEPRGPEWLRDRYRADARVVLAAAGAAHDPAAPVKTPATTEEIGGDECGDLLPGDESLPLAGDIDPEPLDIGEWPATTEETKPWACEDCGWSWPLPGRPPTSAECDSCGGELGPVSAGGEDR